MRPCRTPDRRDRCRDLALALSLVLAVWPAAAQKQVDGSSIYTCIDDQGRRLTSDRPIAACTGKEQQILNRDGSVKAIHPPTLTAEERAVIEARERKASAERMAQLEATRRDKNLLQRYRDEAAHAKGREAALDTVRQAIKATELRMRELEAERVPLMNEAEFYKGKRLPPKLKGQRHRDGCPASGHGHATGRTAARQSHLRHRAVAPAPAVVGRASGFDGVDRAA